MALDRGNGRLSLKQRLIAFLAPKVQQLGYDLIELEFQAKSSGPGSLLRLFIDFLPGSEANAERTIGIDDCVAVDRGLSEYFETSEFEQILDREFTLEVSSPGVDRPLRRPQDFMQFANQAVKVKTFRALTGAEMHNEAYAKAHGKQKNFAGVLLGFEDEKILLSIEQQTIKISLDLVAKANLDVADKLLRKNS